jgi:hypothetical protein
MIYNNINNNNNNNTICKPPYIILDAAHEGEEKSWLITPLLRN